MKTQLEMQPLGATLPPAVKRLLLLPHVDQRTDEWHRMRDRMDVTGSDAASVLEGTHWYSKFKSRNTLFEEKTGQRSRGFAGAAAAHGTYWEDEALAVYAEKTGERPLLFGLVAHPVLEWMGASPDAVTMSGRLVEIKVLLRGFKPNLGGGGLGGGIADDKGSARH